MKCVHNDPTMDDVQEVEIRKKGPSICKKNLQRNMMFPLRCMCSSGYRWPSCRTKSSNSELSGFDLVDEPEGEQ